MTVYFLLCAGIGAMYFLSPMFTADDKKRNNFVYLLFFAAVFLLIALRHPTMGIDLHYGRPEGYLAGFMEISRLSWEEIFSDVPFRNYEKGFVIFCKIVSSIWANEQFFLAMCALAALLPLAIAIYLLSEDKLLSAAVFLGLPLFCLLYSTLRQIIAVGICALALVCIRKKKPLFFLLAVLAAATFHKTALVFLLSYPLYHIRLTKAMRTASLLVPPTLFVLRKNLLLLVTKLLGLQLELDDNGSFMLFFIFCFFYALGILLSDDEKPEQNGYLNIFFVACAVQAFAGVYSIATRVGYYFTLALIFLIPAFVANAKESNERTAARWTFLLAFAAIGLYFIYTTPFSMSYPYYFFWQELPPA